MSKKNTWPYPPNLRDTEIEKALREICASSEDDSDDDGSTMHENYPMSPINEALDNLQGLTRSELLDILEEDRVCTPPIPDPHPPSFSINEDEEMANHRPVACTIIRDPVQSMIVQEPTSSSSIETEQLASHPALELLQEVVQQTPSSAPQLETLQELIDKNRVWSLDTSNFAAPDFKNKLKSNKVYTNRSVPIDYFENMFPSEIITIITKNTNEYARFMLSLNWTATVEEEIKAYLGIVIMMGLHPLPDVELYWSTDPFYHNPVISAVMTCRRFKKITENLHLSDRARELQRTQVGYDKLGKIRQVMDILNKSFKDNCIESQTQSIDESMIKFKGRSTMKQYMPKKPIKRGYKVWARCDSETGYLHQFNVYSGKCESNEDGDGGLGYKVVTELCRTVQADTLIAFDNFFTSLPLMEMLHRKKIYAVGTVRVNRKGLPTCLLPHKGDKRENKLKIGEFMLQYADPVSVIKWRDTKDVYICTTAYDPKKVVTIHRTQKDGQKAPMICPYAIEQYTRNMGGVDRLDHFRSSYSIGRKSTKKNWLRLFWFMLEVACINAYIMYSMTHKTSSSSHKEFRLRLARSLINNFSTRIRDHVIFKNKRGGQYGVADEVRIRNVRHHMPYNAATRKRCRFCSTKKEVKRSKIICKVCKVTLCATPCFENFHK